MCQSDAYHASAIRSVQYRLCAMQFQALVCANQESLDILVTNASQIITPIHLQDANVS